MNNSNSEKCSESIGKLLVLLKYFFFLNIWPAETIASFETIPRLSVFSIILSRKYKDLYPDIDNKLKFDLLDNKTLLVLSESNNNIFLSSRNLQNAKVVLASELNTYDVMNANKLIIMESSMNEIEKNF